MAASPRTSSSAPPSAGGLTEPSAGPEPRRMQTAPRLLLAAGLVGLVKWAVAMLLGAGDIAHILLLASLMLLMLAGLKARDAAVRSALAQESEKR